MRSFCPNDDRKVAGTAPAQPLVSVVTPVHNDAQYLAECIQSVLAQSYTNWEYIIVNNASTDGSLEIAQSFAARDPRICVINTERLLPQTVNFNFSLRQISAASSYCKMVFADDWIYPNCIEEMVALAETDPEVAIVSAFRTDGDWVIDYGMRCPDPTAISNVFDGRDACRRYLLDGAYVFGSQNSVLYRADLMRRRDPLFLGLPSGYFDDAELCFQVLAHAKFGFIHQILTFSRLDNPSAYNSIVKYGPIKLSRYIMTAKYGRRYLSDSEFRECFRKAANEYYGMLARSLFKKRGPGFWHYHARGLELAGISLDWGRISRLQVLYLLNLVGNPKRSMEGLWNLVRSRYLSNAESGQGLRGSLSRGATISR
jgi:glycosyltransferase involved in cell wall biosynthesis